MKEYAKLHTGERLGDYTIDRILGKGGMGAVYLVHDAKGAPFAAKVMMLPDDDDRREWRRRFAKEAGFAMTVHHKNLVAVHDMGEVEATGICYIIMDYMPGGTLSDLLKRKGQLGVREAVDIAIAIASVLEVAHGVGAVHRDIKPDNILFDADGTPKLTDMGIAKFGGANGATTVTATGVIVGTPAYMSPEQMMDSHSVDARADIYSLGLVLYEMLTGTRPHADSTVVELIAKAIKGEELPDICTVRPEVSVALSYVLSLMVAVKPEQRIASAMEAAKMLYDAATDRIVMKRRPARLSATAVNGRMRGLKAVAAWTIGGIMLVSAIAVGAWWMNKPKDPGVQQAPQPGDPPKTSGGDEKPGGGGEIPVRGTEPSKSMAEKWDWKYTIHGTNVTITGVTPTSNVDGVKLPVGSMPKVGLMVAYDYDGGSAVNFGYGTAAVLREDVSYRDGTAVFDGKYQAGKGDDVVIPGFNYDHFSLALSFMPNKEKFSRHFLRMGSLAYGMLDMVPSKRSGEQLRISFSDPRMEKISLPIEIGKWNWVVLSVDVKKRIVMVAVNGVPPVERILPEGFYWTIPSGDIAGDRFRRIHFGNANCGVRYCGAIDDLMVYDRALTQRELQDIVRGVPYGGSATASASPGSSPLVFPRARPVDGKWVLARQPEMSQYWNGTITMGGITLGVREDKDGLAVPPIGKLSHETIDLSRPVVDEDGKEFPIYAIGSPFDGVYCAGGSSVKTIRLPQSLRELRSLAIAGCSRLETISLPNTLEIIGDSAFYFCSSLESVVIPENVRQVGARAFESCGSLAKVEILSKSVTIAKDAFARGTPVGSAVPKENWTTGPVTKEVRGDPTLAYAKKGRMKEPLFFFSYGGIRFGESHGDVGGWGSTPMRGQRSLGEFDIHFHKVGPGLLAGIELTWRKKCEVEGNAEEAVAAASKIISILKSKLNGNIDTPRILPKSEWPEYGDMGNFYAMYEQIKAIGTSESEVNGYKVKVNVYCGRKDKNVAVVISVIDSYMFKAWGAPAPGE